MNRCPQGETDSSCFVRLKRTVLRRLLPLIAVIAMTLAAFPLPAQAQGRRIRVGVNAGYGVSTIGGKNTGFALEYLREIGKRTGDTFQYVSGSMSELAAMLANGEIDIIPCVTAQEFPVWKDMAKAQGYDGELSLSKYSLMTKFSAVYVHSDSDIAYYDLDTLKTKRIGCLSEDREKFFPNGSFLTPELRQAEFVWYNTEEQMREDFNSKKIDAVAKDCFRVWSNDIIVCQMATEECYFMGADNTEDILADFDEAVGGISMIVTQFSADLYDKYVSKYGGQRYAYTEEEKYYVKNNPKLIIGVNVQASILDIAEGSTVTGAVAKTLGQLGEISGLNIELVPYNGIKECIVALTEGKVNAICGGVNPSSVAAYSGLRTTAPYAKVPIAAAGKTGSTISERSRIAIPAYAEDINEYIVTLYPRAAILTYDDEKQCLEAVKKGEADAAYAGAYDLLYALNGNFSGLDIIDVRDSVHMECLAIPESELTLANILGKSLAVMSNNSTLVNTFSQIAADGVDARSVTPFDKYLVWIICGVLVILTGLFSVICFTTFRSRRVEAVDPLTGGRSKNQFFDDARKLLRKNGAKKWAIALFDIDKFKYVNDRLGYDEGNRMLERLHKTISDHLENDEVFARLSDDNFAMMIKDGTDSEITARINSIFTEFERRNSLFVKYPVVFSAGVCRMNQFMNETHHAEVDISAAVDRCKIAKSTIKGTHNSSLAFYDGSIRDKALREKDYENTMPAALQRHEFQCYLQPKYGLRSRNIEGAEALIRWNSKDFGFISPGDFIPIAEKNGFVVELDFFILEEVCRTMRKWINDGKKPVVISVNQSRLHLNYDDYIWRLREIVEKYDIPYEYIELELTESVFTENSEKLLKIMHKLHEIGFKLSLDDFGSGYSSLNMLKDMPVDVVKIDKEFFSDTMNTSKGRAVISTVVDLAKNLDMDVISEGVETREQVEFLTEIHCAMVQGYYFAKPMPISDFEKLWYADLEEIRLKKEAEAAKQQQRLDAMEHLATVE